MAILKSLSDKAVRGVRRLNARLLPPEKYTGTINMGLSAFEEVYLIAKNFIDGSIHVSERMLYEDQYHEQRLAGYAGQKRLLVFVPGYMQAPSGFARLERLLGLSMFGTFTYLWGGFPYSQDITLTAKELEAVLRDIVGRTEVDEIFLLGHSQGGMIIRAMVQHGLGADLPISKCMFLSSPHQGTWAALAAVPHRGLRKLANAMPISRTVQGESGFQLLQGSEFLRQLNSRPLPEHIKFYSVHYALDPMIWPPTNAILPYPEADNFYVPKIGHAQSLYCSRAARLALRCLYADVMSDAEQQDTLTDMISRVDLAEDPLLGEEALLL